MQGTGAVRGCDLSRCQSWVSHQINRGVHAFDRQQADAETGALLARVAALKALRPEPDDFSGASHAAIAPFHRGAEGPGRGSA